MNKLYKTTLLLSVILIGMSCASKDVKELIGGAVADGADTQVAYDAHGCRTLQMRCVQGDFQEWETSDKVMGCSCKKL